MTEKSRSRKNRGDTDPRERRKFIKRLLYTTPVAISLLVERQAMAQGSGEPPPPPSAPPPSKSGRFGPDRF
jgi:hypothetical protein